MKLNYSTTHDYYYWYYNYCTYVLTQIPLFQRKIFITIIKKYHSSLK